MSPENILGPAFVAVLNSLWQSAAMALLVWAALRFLPQVNIRINAATRCAVWWAVLAAVVILPMAPQRARVADTPPPVSSQAASIPEPAIPEPAGLTPVETSPGSSRFAGPVQITGGAGLLAVFAIFAIWSALSLFRIAQIVRSYRYLRGIKERSRGVSPEQLLNFNYWLLACGIDRTARLLVSSEIVSPMAVGFRRPAVIVPETLLTEFTAEELDHVILHELAHIARYDDWTNLFARIIGALLPIHPVAVWLIKNIGQEREVACDDWVVAMTGQARPYAASLTRLFELCSARRRQLLATGMADRASHLGERIEALLRAGRDFAPRVSLVRVALGGAIILGLVLAGAQTPHWIAFAQERPVPPVPPAPSVTPLPAVPPAAPVAPIPPVPAVPAIPPVAAQPDPELLHDIEAVQDDAANQIRAAEEQLRAREAQLRAMQAQLEAQRAQGRQVDEIRAFEAQLQGQKMQMAAMQAALRAQIEQRQQVAQNRASAPGGSFLAALVAAGYGDLPVDAIIELRNSGVSAEFLRSVAEAGWGKLSVRELMDLAHSGVSPQYLRSLNDAGFKNLSVQEAIEVAHSGVRPDLIRALKDAFPQITMRQIVDAAHSGLNANDLRQAREYGPNLTLEQILKLKHAGVI
jgi:beta-lactamase regulating signal transducer with metallopeptidase domain